MALKESEVLESSPKNILPSENSETVIKVEGLSKKFCRSLKRSMYYGSVDILRNMLGISYDSGHLRKNEFWALEDISFELKKGETLGIIGVNGSGKSTLLRLLTGIFPPDRGRITVDGRIGSLIAVGAGFHPYMTGRENIYLNGTILGMTKKEIEEKFESIVNFADIGDFLEAPVSTYSSGMRVRLGFAIAVHCDPDILLVDEVLSVGDLSFRNKCLRYMAKLREKAKGIVFISHNLEQVRVLCNRVIILNKGKIIYDGQTHEGCVRYEELSRDIRQKALKIDEKSLIDLNSKFIKRTTSEDDIELIDVGIAGNNLHKLDKIKMDEPLNFICEFILKKDVESLYFSAGILNEEFKPCIWVMSNDNNKVIFNNLKKGKYRLLIKIPEHHLMPNVYIPIIAIRNCYSSEMYEKVYPNYSFKVASDDILERGIVSVKEEWILENIN